MNKVKEGFIQAIVGVIGAIIFGAVLTSLKQDESIPKDNFWIFTFIGLAGSISTIWFLKTAGFLFNIGWIIAAWLLKDAMDIEMFLVFFIAPIVVLVIRVIFLFKNSNSRG